MARHFFSVVLYLLSAMERTLLASSTTVPCLVESIAPCQHQKRQLLVQTDHSVWGSQGLEERSVHYVRHQMPVGAVWSRCTAVFCWLVMSEGWRSLQNYGQNINSSLPAQGMIITFWHCWALASFQLLVFSHVMESYHLESTGNPDKCPWACQMYIWSLSR